MSIFFRISGVRQKYWPDIRHYIIVLCSRPNYGEHALVIITAILTIIILVGLILGVYKRWQQVT